MKNAKRLLSLLLVFVLVAAVVPLRAKADTWDGAASDTTWYNAGDTAVTVTTAAQLKGLADLVNGGTSFQGVTVTLGADIDLNSQEWTPIGTNANPFKGIFDGGSHTVSNLKVSGSNSYVGLFGMIFGNEITPKPGVKNLTVTNVKVSGTSYVGGVVGNAFVAEIVNCHVNGTVSLYAAQSYVGGIMGHGYGAVVDCSVIAEGLGSIANDPDVGGYVGGIAGQTGEGGNVIRGCTVKNIRLSGDCLGGICGIAQAGVMIRDNVVNNVMLEVYAAGSTQFNGLIAGDNRGSESSPSYVINNQHSAVSATIGGTTPFDNTVGMGYSGGNTVVGVGVVLDENNKVLFGRFSSLPASAVAPTSDFLDNGDGTFSAQCNHTGGTATCQVVAVCDLCKTGYGKRDPDNHAGSLKWYQTEKTHVQWYDCCPELVPEGTAHNWENGVCMDCSYTCVHTGGTATCKDKAKCEICGEEYGELSATHTGGTATCKDKAKCEICGTEYGELSATHTGGTATCKDKAKCEICGTEYGELSATHTGGTATCKDKAKCEICGEEYGELSATHTGGTATCKDKAKCEICGTEYGELSATHTGGTATCKDKAKCEVCGAEYGELDSKNHAGEGVWAHTDAKHTKTYACCGAVEEGEHTLPDGKCVCGYEAPKPAPPADDSNATTGDSTPAVLLCILALLGIGGTAALLVFRKKFLK